VRFPNVSNWLAYRLKIFLPVGMRRWLERHGGRFDVVHLFDARTLPNAWAAEVAVKQSVPFVVSVWGSLPRGDGWRSAIKARYDRRHGGFQLEHAAALLAQNEHEAEVYREYGADASKVALWPLAVDPKDVAQLPQRGTFRASLGIPSDDAVVLFVGRIHELKGLELLTRAFASAWRREPRLRLVVVGRDDGYLPRLEALVDELGIRSRFTFAGPKYGKDALAAYVDADLFAITPTHFEETSLASLMACAAGCPVLVTDRCGVPWLEQYGAGVTVAHDVTAIARVLAELMSAPEELAQMGKRARRLAEERFFLGRVTEQLESIYEGARRSAHRTGPPSGERAA
jgi:glycosyltransferase involved in cell wall biosynthesis